jgi:hypothetical protein
MFSPLRKAAVVVFVGTAFASALAATLVLRAALTLVGGVRTPGAPRAES